MNISLVSIFAVIYNRLEYTKKTIELIRERTTIPYELILVDNGSNKKTRDWILAQKDAVKILNTENVGVARACNQAIGVARGDPVVFVGSDLEVPYNWLEALINVLRVPRVGVAAIREEEIELETTTVGGVGLCIKESNVGGLTAIPRRTIDKIGYFNEMFKYYSQEDGEYGMRVKLAGLWNA